MPKTKACKYSNLHKYTAQYNDVFKTYGKILFCKVCEKVVNSERKFLVDQHVKSQKHLELCDRRKGKATQALITNLDADAIDRFSLDLCEAFVSADIPLAKLRNPSLTNFLKKYTNENIPSDTTLRNKYVDKLYDMQLKEIRTYLRNRYLWISIDETTDIEGRYIANVIVGILDKDENISKKRFLLNVVELEKTNHATIARTFHDSIKMLGEEFNKDNILLFLTDAAPYMVKAAKALIIFYPKLIHVTCLAHALHRVADEVRSHFADIDLLISSGKKIFLKAPSRVAMLKEKYPGLSVPPQPVVTRWGSWLEAVEYYKHNFDDFRSAILELDDSESSSIKKVQEILHLYPLYLQTTVSLANP